MAVAIALIKEAVAIAPIEWFQQWEQAWPRLTDVLQTIFLSTPARLVNLYIVLALAKILYDRAELAGNRIVPPTFNATGQKEPQFLSIGSTMDEAWQILHHLRKIDNPLGVPSGPFRYLAQSAVSHISRSAEIARINGAKSYKDVGIVSRCLLAIVHLVYALLVIAAIYYNWPGRPSHVVLTTFLAIGLLVFPLLFTPVFGAEFYSAFWLPFRWCARGLNTIKYIFTDSATYFVRSRSWKVVLAIVMGLEGYRHRLPAILQYPSWLPQNFVKYEDMPSGAEQRALAKRKDWISRHLGDVEKTFAKMAVTATDIAVLQHTIEADTSLVHAAYYSDDECIARIADWIAGKATNG